MKVLLVASDKAELRDFPDSYEKAVCGTGPIASAAVTAAAIASLFPDAVVSVGSAGSFGRIPVGSCVSFGSVVSPDQDLTAYHLRKGATLLPSRATVAAIRLGDSSPYVLSSSGSFCTAPDPDIPADAADMEAYGVAMAAYLKGIPCFAVKVITDVIGEHIDLGSYGFRLRSLRSLLVQKTEQVLSSL